MNEFQTIELIDWMAMKASKRLWMAMSVVSKNRSTYIVFGQFLQTNRQTEGHI